MLERAKYPILKLELGVLESAATQSWRETSDLHDNARKSFIASKSSIAPVAVSRKTECHDEFESKLGRVVGMTLSEMKQLGGQHSTVN